MNRTELIEKIAKSVHLPKKEVVQVLDMTLATVRYALKKGDQVKLAGFGTFYVGKRAARMGVNPRTKAAMKIKSSQLPKFRASARLRNALK